MLKNHCAAGTKNRVTSRCVASRGPAVGSVRDRLLACRLSPNVVCSTPTPLPVDCSGGEKEVDCSGGEKDRDFWYRLATAPESKKFESLFVHKSTLSYRTSKRYASCAVLYCICSRVPASARTVHKVADHH